MTQRTTKVFQNQDFLHGDGMLTKIWGPSLWHSLHVISFNYPVHPSQKDKHSYRNFILNLKNVLPCKHCRNNLKKTFAQMPLKMEHMSTRHTFSKYVYDLHEHVNIMLKKKSNISYCQVRELYEHFRARCNKTRKTGCTEPLVGKKSKCILRIVPDDKKTHTMKVSKSCLKKRKKENNIIN